MGPIALFDKSFLQALSVDEAVLFDYFFLPVISPLFFVETLGDLSREPTKGGRSPAEIVGSIAFKSPEMHGAPCAFHGTLGHSSLLGFDPPFTGQIPRTGGKRVQVGENRGVVFEPSEEAQAFGRWQEDQFLELERQYASRWRAALSQIDLRRVAASTARFGVDPKTAKNLEQVRDLAGTVLRRLSPAEQLKLALQALSIPERDHEILTRWFRAGNPPLRDFARYANFVTEIEVFFALALASGKISAERASNRCDISYLFYLPFCNVFISSDRLHRDCAPFFLRSDQDFVWGPDLKRDLAAQNELLLALPEAERDRGLVALAPTPQEGLIRRLWEKHVPRALLPPSHVDLSAEGSAGLASMVQEFASAPAHDQVEDAVFEGELDSVTQQRMLQHKRGSWYQLPKDLPKKSGA